jgi:hypothetical protein
MGKKSDRMELSKDKRNLSIHVKRFSVTNSSLALVGV